jgi:hypothetical protein
MGIIQWLKDYPQESGNSMRKRRNGKTDTEKGEGD